MELKGTVPRKFVFHIILLLIACRVNRTNSDASTRPVLVSETLISTDTVIPGTSLRDKYKVIFDSLVKTLPDYFTVIIEKPFIIIGDEIPDIVRQRAENTVRWAATKLKQNYFKKDPKKIINIWLFKNDSSYYFHANKIFSDQPPSKFGYYLPQYNALLMNISTGGGTLVHEIVHPYIDANFPDCPPWFNEGLASLYEQCGEKNGSIYGYTNWRLSILQDAIRNDVIPSFKELMAMNAFDFYDDKSGIHYSQARYLCYYLQEKNKLVDFYHAFVKNYADDSTGYLTLQSVLNENDIINFQERWQQFVMQLHFP